MGRVKMVNEVGEGEGREHMERRKGGGGSSVRWGV